MTDPLLPGDPATLGSVRLLGRLGAGGMGRVYLGRTTGGRLVAVKTVHAHLAAEPQFRERFRREAAAARAVTGAHTAAVLDADPASPVPWLATAYLPGVTLRGAVAAAGPLEVPVVRSLGAALAEALTSIHGAGLVHRDLKPSNVLVTAQGPRVIDFGIARALGDHGMTRAGDIIGTPGFIAPEQITDSGPVTAAADVFALGAVLAFAATGRNPFGDGTAAILLYRAVHEEPDLDDVPARIRGLVAGCLEKEPARRPSVGAVLERTADPGAALWWREEPLRSLISGDEEDRPRERTAVVPTKEVTAATVPAPRPDEPRVAPAAGPGRAERAERAERRRGLARRGALVAGGATLAGLFGVSVVRGWGDPGPGGTVNSSDGAQLDLRKGSAKPGALRWSLTSEPGGVDAFQLSGGTVLLHGPLTSGVDGYVRACAASDGARRWELTATDGAPGVWGVAEGILVAPDVGLPLVGLGSGKALGKADPFSSSPLRWISVVGGTLITAYQDDTDTKELRAVDLRTGASRWEQERPGTQPPTVLGDTMLLATALGGQVLGVDGASAGTLWSYEGLKDGGDQLLAAGALPDAGNFALLTTLGELHLVGARNGERVAVAADSYAVTPGATAVGAAGGTGLLATAGSLHGFDPDSAKPLWPPLATLGVETSWPRRTGGVRGPVTAGGLVLHWSKADTLQAVDPRTGEPRWTRRLTGIAKVPPVVTGGTVYAACGEVCTALRLTDGAVRRTWSLPGIIDGLAADASGWYGRIGTSAVRAYNGVGG
ncbi:Serine/threonine-protein kinase AfsK [Streptomyces sp. S4.7]|uniref:serine/threonine-protein kinase n=1 Tax=Streptomyces sp. S4.7 TaxID=2705439 RepID=UPI001396E518|nr:serine/threonine-protein kinase [Streptomyces sp. S4.7]QHY94853.1 Serine/threonine-protein kinase AfsK [Streptomyces sp. S4.7]